MAKQKGNAHARIRDTTAVRTEPTARKGQENNSIVLQLVFFAISPAPEKDLLERLGLEPNLRVRVQEIL